MKETLRRAKILADPVTRVEALEAGFRYAYWRRFRDYPFGVASLEELASQGSLTQESRDILADADELGIRFAPDKTFVNPQKLAECHQSIGQFLVALGSSDAALMAIPSDPARYAELRKLAAKVSRTHDAWLRAGIGVFTNTALLGFDLVATSDAEGRAVLARDDVRNTGAILISALEDLGWSPDLIEPFFLEKIVPHLHEKSLRKWVFALNMAVMSDLRSIASEADKANAVSTGEERAVGASKALIESIPFVGKAIAILVFGEKKK